MVNIIQIITAIAALTEAIAQANNAIHQSAQMIKKAQEEGRDLTDDELNAAQAQYKASMNKLRELK